MVDVCDFISKPTQWRGAGMGKDIARMIAAELFDISDRCVSVELLFSYFLDDPLALHMSILIGDMLVSEWVFARDLAMAGTRYRVGDGAVSVWPAVDNSVVIRIQDGMKRALLRLNADELADFTSETYELVGNGEEFRHVDIGRAVALQCGMVSDQ
ncbi:SsgA family sporulation/cell division regulator [Streptomyces sp. NPDC051014]|uniref:SsgA family sporulation/cell division regulator n=1 Tax=Streptomyces sp. NPDC051014 TaxID=3155751 RepID=UPI0033EE0DCF